MPRNLTLEPKYVEALNRWQLYISPMLSSTGKPQRLFYRTKRAAETAAEVFERRQKNLGRNLSSSLPHTWPLRQRLSNSSAIATTWRSWKSSGLALAHEKAKTASVPFGNLFDEFLAAKAVRNPKYVKGLKLTRERFRRFDKVLAADLQPKALSEILDRMPPAARNANMRYLRAAFNLGYLRENPIAHLDFQELPSAESFGGNPAFKAKREFPRPSPKRSRPTFLCGNQWFRVTPSLLAS